MGLITGLLTLPLAPVRGVAWIAEQVAREVDRQWSDPGVLQAQLDEIDRMRVRGELDDAEADAREEALIQRLLGSGDPGAASGWTTGEAHG